MIKIQNRQTISVQDFNDLVEETYGKPYNYQQQDDCHSRGKEQITVPVLDHEEEFENDTIPEEVNGDEMGVTFAAWLARDPKEWNGGKLESWTLVLFWHRNFYPDLQMVLNDLHAKGLIPAGEYDLDIDW